MRMIRMCGKMLRDGIPNGLVRDRTSVEDEACASMMPKTKSSGDDARVQWSTPINWEEDLATRQNGEEDR